MKKPLLSMALLSAAWLASGTAQAWDEPAQVNGVYQIGTASELEWFAEYVNSVTGDSDPDKVAKLTANAVLTADIDLDGISHTPIGKSTTYKYEGTFDGQHHVISNMTINLPDQENVGFFGLVRGSATIKNIIIDSSCSVTGKNRVAGLIGCVQTQAGTLYILNCVNKASVLAKSGVASGIVGAGQSGYPFFKMHNCVNTGSISTEATNNYTVAFNGYNNLNAGNSQVWCCYNTGTLNRIDGGNNIFRGGYRSVLNTYDLVNTASNMQSQSNIPSGGFTTDDPLHSGELCYYLNHGIEMQNRADVSLGEEFTQDLSDPNSIPMPNATGPKVYQVADFYCDGTAKGTITYSNTDGGSRDPHQFNPATGFCTVCGALNEEFVAVSADGFYHLSTVAQVEWFSQMVRLGHHGGMDVKLDADINFGGVPNAHLPIGTSGHKYWGHFDGQGHRIIGMVLNNELVQDNAYDGKGFFGSVRGGGTDDVWNVTKNNPIIENLIIDESCSIVHNQNFAAGVVAHINSTNSGVTIIIRNCGNEANVTTSGKNAAGILGCVEATNVGLVLHNLWNKGNITGQGGESAAICAWTGQRNTDGEVDVEGCWNIGEVTGVDGNGYNMIRRNSSIVPRNIVDLCTTNAGNQGKVSVWNTTDPISSGELCYLLNGDQTTIVYTQNLGTDEMPVYRNASHSQVYQAGTVNCLGAAVGGVTYNNTSGETVTLDHQISEEMGMCSVCHTQFQEPAMEGDYYLLKNAGNVEWLSNAVKGGGGAAFYAKLMNDIDFYGIENLHSPIGPTTGSKFKGVFDGQGYRIMNMTINRPSDNNIGFFGFLQGNSSTLVKNLIIDSSCSISANNRVGGITGSYQNGGNTITLENVVNEATIHAKGQDAGGLIGGHESGGPTIIIKNCMNVGDVTSDHEDAYVGALCCYMEVGGGSKIENFLNLGTIGTHKGGNIGRHNIGDVTNLIDLSDTENKTQGVVAGLTVDDVENGKVAYILSWYQELGEDNYPMPFAKEGATVYRTGVERCDGADISGTVYSNTYSSITPGSHDNNATTGFCNVCSQPNPSFKSLVDGAYELGNHYDLTWFAAMVNTGNPAINGRLTSDVDMSGVDYTPIGNNDNKYHGTFDGSGHKVNLDINANAYGQGFISIATGGTTIRNLVITGTVKNAGSKTAGIIAEAIGGGVVTIQNCGNEATIQGTSGETAAIVANNWGYQCTLNIENVYNIGSVSGEGDVSTICACQGNSSSVFKNVYNSGSVTGATQGNFVRPSNSGYGTYTNCYSTTLSNDNASIISTNTSAVASGELCAKLGFGFRQNLSSDAYPNFASDHGFVAQIGAAGYSTMYNKYSDVTIPSGIEAFAGVVNGENLSLVAITDAIAKEEPVVLKGNADLYNFMPTTGASKASSNSLSGSNGSVTSDGSTIFALANGENGVGFYPVGDGVTIPAGKAYLEITGSAVKGFTFVFDDDATGIESIQNSKFKIQNEDAAIFNLAGQRLNKMQKGINVVNGKKVMIK